MSGLSVSNLVRVTVSLTPSGAQPLSFGILMIAGDSDVINGTQRFRTYTDIETIAEEFGVDAPEYKAAQLYFGQSPQPSTCMVGRWFREASAAELDGGILSSSEQALANWTAVSNGSFDITIDNVDYSITGLDFSGETNLNGVASVISAGLSGEGSTAVCTWNGSFFVITSGTTGEGVKASGQIFLDTNPSPGVRATGTITLNTNPANGDTLNINGTTVTFVSGTAGALEVHIGTLVADTAANLQTFLEASADSGLAASTYSTIGTVTTITARAYGTAGNSYVLTRTSAHITVSGSGTLASGVAADTLTVNGTAFTFVATTPAGNQILVGPTVAMTAANVQSTLAASVVSGVAEATYATSGTTTTVTYKTVGTDGNSFTLAESSSHIHVSAGTLEDGAEGSQVGYATATGSGTDVSVQLKFTADDAQAAVPSFDAETPAECAVALAAASPLWYGLMFQASEQPTDEENVDVADVIEALSVKRVFGITITNTDVLSSLVDDDLASTLKDAGYLRTFSQYSQNAYAVASFFGRNFSVNFSGQNTVIAMMYKQEPAVTPETISASQATTLKNKNCNVFVNYINDTAIVQYGVMADGTFFDEVHDTDWLQNAIQTNVYNALYTSLTKIPQTDAGVNQIVNAIADACNQGVLNGTIAPGTWNGPSFGSLVSGQYLKNGFYIFAQSVALQSQAARAARECPQIQVAVKLAGAIQTVDILVSVNQ
jgi:hypothetical protein